MGCAPCIGALIDARGFTLPVLSLGFWSVVFALLIWQLTLRWQWLTLLSLNVLLAHVYGIQYAYIAQTYSISQFGLLMSLSCLVQSVVNPLSSALVDRIHPSDVKVGSLVFAI